MKAFLIDEEHLMTETDIVFNGESVTVSIPAGTYDCALQTRVIGMMTALRSALSAI